MLLRKWMCLIWLLSTNSRLKSHQISLIKTLATYQYTRNGKRELLRYQLPTNQHSNQSSRFLNKKFMTWRIQNLQSKVTPLPNIGMWWILEFITNLSVLKELMKMLPNKRLKDNNNRNIKNKRLKLTQLSPKSEKRMSLSKIHQWAFRKILKTRSCSISQILNLSTREKEVHKTKKRKK